jgi:hypothetical protein
MSDRCRLSRDPGEPVRDSEFSWGPGLVPPGYEYAPPGTGGMYRGKCPPVELTRSPDLSVRVRIAQAEAGDPPLGYPGKQVAR